MSSFDLNRTLTENVEHIIFAIICEFKIGHSLMGDDIGPGFVA